MKLKDIGEHEFIRKIISKYIGNNIITLDAYSDSKKIYKIDGFSLSYKFPFMDYYDLGWKAVTSVASDIIVSGGKPDVLLASIGIDPEIEVNELELLLRGIYDASSYYGFKYVGGDTNSSQKSGWIDIVGIGDVICNYSNNANFGDVIVITDMIGYTSKVFISYLNQFEIPIDIRSKLKIKHPVINRSLIKFISSYCNKLVTATDISDGLIISLQNLAERLNKNIKLTDIPVDIKILEELKKYGYDVNDILKYSGEEYEFLIVIRKEYAADGIKFLSYYGLNPMIIGYIEDLGNKIIYNNKEIKISGWDNFKGWY